MIIESLLKNCIQEYDNCQHLFTKLDPAQAEWRPQENMRSTLELLQYLTYIGGTMIRHFPNPPTDHEEARNRYRADSTASKTMSFSEFPTTIDREKKAITDILSKLTDADLARTTYHMWSGEESSLFDSLFTIVRYLTAYRQQLFLYAKLCGAEISTPNNWYGRDPVKQAA
ncbi:MAG TPA: DinB family protein [Candidatus Kapabacteria bacterium]